MLTHERVWGALDALARNYDLSTSALAKKSGLDSTAFNRSKRWSNGGRPRWPSTESVAKALHATGATLDEFMELVTGVAHQPRGHPPLELSLPMLGFAQAGVGGFFEDGGFPAGHGWDEVAFPFSEREGTYALKVSGDSMSPLYRDGDVLIVMPDARVHKGDRVVVKTVGGEVMAKVLAREAGNSVELVSFNPDHKPILLDRRNIEWMARILWASQ